MDSRFSQNANQDLQDGQDEQDEQDEQDFDESSWAVYLCL